MKRKTFVVISLFLLSFLFLGILTAQGAERTVRIGSLWPLSGPGSREGQEAKAILDLAVEIINNKTDLKGIPLAETEGLPNLGGAKIELVYGDHQAKPEIGRAETERLITVEKVVAMIGSYHSSVTLAATPVADKYAIPFLVPDSTNPDICKKGFKTVFRTTPTNITYVRDAIDMIDDLQKKFGTNYKRVVVSNDTSFQGVDFGRGLKELAIARGYHVLEQLGTQEPATDLTPDVLKIKSLEPEILLTHHYTGNAILFQNAFRKYRVNAKLVATVSNAYNIPDFIKGAGNDANYVFTPGTFPPKFIGNQPVTAKVNEMFKKKHGRDMSDGRYIVGLIVLADAINRAKSTDSNAVIKALSETNLNQDQVIMPWKGVKFDSTGENVLASIVMQQILNGKYEIVWPLNRATADAVWPAPTWEERIKKGE